MLTGFISVKIIALIVGPTGIALLGQLNNFSTIITTIASGGINSGVTKYVAESGKTEEKVKQWLSTGLQITVWSSLACGIVVVIFHQFLSKTILLSGDYGFVFVIFGSTITLYSLNMLIASILNGFKEYKKYVLVSIVGSIFGLLFTIFCVLVWQLPGALVSAVTFQSIMFFISFGMIRKLHWVNKSYFIEKFNWIIGKKYFKYTLMTFTSAATAPVSQLILRGYVITNISFAEAGWWEAMNRISNMYLMIITTSFGVYYLPRLSELRNDVSLKQEISKAYKLIIPILICGFSLIYFFRFLIIRILFTDEFLSMENLFFWQLCADFFKISSWLLAYLMLAKAMTKAFISTEILFNLLFISLSFFFMKFNGLVGITQALAINYLLYFLFMIFVFRKIIFIKNES
jgi:PST family polysaccharide transporter